MKTTVCALLVTLAAAFPCSADEPPLQATLPEAPAPPPPVEPAQPAFGPRGMALSQDIQTYFDGEEREGFAWLALGGPGLGVGAVAASQPGDLAKGLAAPTLLFGGVHEFIGLYLLGITEARVAELRRNFALDPRGVASAEKTRIDGVIRGFKILTIAEAVIAAAGVGSLAVGLGLKNDAAIGAGVGLAVESLLTLLLDNFAWRRAKQYATQLSAFLGG